MNVEPIVEHLRDLRDHAIENKNWSESAELYALMMEFQKPNLTIEEVEKLISCYKSISKAYGATEEYSVLHGKIEEEYALPYIVSGELSHFIHKIKKEQPVRFGELSPNHETLLLTAYANKLIDIDEGEIYVSSTAYAQLAQ